MKALLNTVGVLPLFLKVQASSVLLYSNYQPGWDTQSVVSGALLGGTSLLMVLKMVFYKSE